MKKKGQMKKYSPIQIEEDYFIPVRNRDRTSAEDVEYFRNKLFDALKIPKKYLEEEE